MKLTFKKNGCISWIVQQVNVFPSNSKVFKANYAYKTMCKLSLLNILLGISLFLGWGGGSTSLTVAATVGIGNEWQAELAGGLLELGHVADLQNAVWYISSKLHFCERWAMGSAYPLWGYAMEKFGFLYVCGYFSWKLEVTSRGHFLLW